MKKNAIDFIIIGAQKSGTTSLFKYLSSHPEIFMTPTKETEFFSNHDKFSKGIQWYIDMYFKNSGLKLRGEASTHYMIYNDVSNRIKQTIPDVKLIAILRNPIERAYSHYRMSKMREIEKRSFSDAIDCAIERAKSLNGNSPDETFDYVAIGEYGRILTPYFNLFNRKDIKIIFMEDLLNKPELILKELFEFLEVKDDFTPPNIGKKYNVGGKRIIKGLDDLIRKILRVFRRNSFGRKLISQATAERLHYWTLTSFNIKSGNPSKLDDNIRNKLKRYYQNDIELLTKLIDKKTPWEDFS